MLRAETIQSSSLYNKDLAPVSSERRTWRTYNYAALWISMSVNIPTYMLASGMIAGGMNWKQALFTVFLGNVLVLIPMLLNAHAGAQYGIPFPVFARASFGVLGANVPAILRALVACGWFGIQTWIGGEAINAMIVALAPSWAHVHSGPALCFAFFWLLNVLVILRGIETIRFLQGISAPFLLLIGLALLLWARNKAGGFGPMLATPSKFQTFGEFFRFFIPSLTGVVGFWATVSLNIPDFTRYARGQRDQIVGQALGLPATMTFYSFIGIAVTSATLIIFGEALWNPVAVLARLGNPFAVVLAMIALLMATLNVNVAANVVSLARRLLRLSRADCRRAHLRLLRNAQESPHRRGSVSAQWPLRILSRVQLDGHLCIGGRCRSRIHRLGASAAARPVQLRLVRGLPGKLPCLLRVDEPGCTGYPAGGLRRTIFHGLWHHHQTRHLH